MQRLHRNLDSVSSRHLEAVELLSNEGEERCRSAVLRLGETQAELASFREAQDLAAGEKAAVQRRADAAVAENEALKGFWRTRRGSGRMSGDGSSCSPANWTGSGESCRHPRRRRGARRGHWFTSKPNTRRSWPPVERRKAGRRDSGRRWRGYSRFLRDTRR